jgi:hypothetical protein
MTDVVTIKTPPVLKTSQWPHVALGLLALAALVASGMPRFAQYAQEIRGACALLGLGTFAACRAYLGERIWGIVQRWSPDPIPLDIPAAPVAPPPEVKP